MNRYLLSLLLTLSLAGSFTLALAETDTPTDSTKQRHRVRAGKIADALGLTDEQKAQVKQIMTEAREQAEQAQSPEQKHEILKAARQEVHNTVLTDEQRAKVKDHFQNRMKRRAGRIADALDMTDVQKAQAETILSAARQKASEAESVEQKRQIMQAARKQVHETVLTDEQREKVKEHLRSRMKQRAGRIANALDMTDEQKAQVKQIMSEAHEQAKQAESREDKRQIMQAARVKIHADVLTDEQREKAGQFRRRHRQGQATDTQE